MLERSVGQVSDEEARNGASQSDGIRLSAREQYQDDKVPMSVYLSRAAQFRADLKKSKTEEPKEPECPIKKARAESTTGENVPLNWLMADQFGGQSDFSPQADDLYSLEQGHSSLQEGGSEFTAQPRYSIEAQSFMDNEWLLSPCA